MSALYVSIIGSAVIIILPLMFIFKELYEIRKIMEKD